MEIGYNINKMKTILITGAAGFIGAAVANVLIKTGNKVITIDNYRTPG
ncbi:hypothetical protein FACS1894181_01340 [Bacteroidia bacterium]|nr:hypothetical protein FACS1894181_01340 [Bacteroidia bacterium]